MIQTAPPLLFHQNSAFSSPSLFENEVSNGASRSSMSISPDQSSEPVPLRSEDFTKWSRLYLFGIKRPTDADANK